MKLLAYIISIEVLNCFKQSNYSMCLKQSLFPETHTTQHRRSFITIPETAPKKKRGWVCEIFHQQSSNNLRYKSNAPYEPPVKSNCPKVLSSVTFSAGNGPFGMHPNLWPLPHPRFVPATALGPSCYLFLAGFLPPASKWTSPRSDISLLTRVRKCPPLINLCLGKGDGGNVQNEVFDNDFINNEWLEMEGGSGSVGELRWNKILICGFFRKVFIN